MTGSRAILGVDPGVDGGAAVLRPDGTIAYLRALNPEMGIGEITQAVHAAVAALRIEGSRTCFMEKVGQIRGDGAQGAFTFGRISGILEGALWTHGLSMFMVYPQMWQARLECLSGGNKNVTKRKAQELFPREKITHNIADALLIAEYGRRRFAL